jgi:hypothetical protein
MENMLLKLSGNEWPECFCGHITQKRKLWRKRNGRDVRRWQALQGRYGMVFYVPTFGVFLVCDFSRFDTFYEMRRLHFNYL